MSNNFEHTAAHQNTKSLRVLMSGGGTGGHIFPAIAIAQEIKTRFPNAEFLFIGAEGKMEMEKVPQAGFKIVGLNIAGFNRGNLLSNLSLPMKLWTSVNKAKQVIKDFKPDFAVGTGGFASGPALWAAASLGIPIFIQEQNAYPGITNKLLSKKAKAVFTAYPNMEKDFPKTKTIFSGNPIRNTIVTDMIGKEEAKTKLGLDPKKLTILSVGGSLGSRTLNNAWKEHLNQVIEKDFQLIWQTGKLDYKNIVETCQLPIGGINQADNRQLTTDNPILIREFISDMALAYSAADVIVSRAGAIAISEMTVAQKPILLVPFPFAAEDHQTKNALNLTEKNAARMVRDSEMKEKFWDTLLEVCDNEILRIEMAQNVKFFAKENATKEIVDEILNGVMR